MLLMDWRKYMKNLIRLTDYGANDIYDIFELANDVSEGKYHNLLKGRA